MAAQLAQVAAGTTPAATPRPDLTADQRVLLGHIADGDTQDAIARRYGVTKSCIDRRLRVAYRRLGALNAPHAVAIAYRAGLLPAPDRPALDRPAQPAWDHCGPGGISNPHPLHPGQSCGQYDATRARR